MISDGLFSVVLAAGSSRRFGSSKQLAPYQDRTLIRTAVDLAESVTGDRTIIVVGANWKDVVDACLPCAGFFVRNERHESGLASSIACGIDAVGHVASAVLLVLADQPLIGPDHVRELEARWQASPGSIVASHYAGTSGPPIIFPAEYFVALGTLEGDQGARRIVSANSASVISVRCDAGAVDIDSPDDLRQLY